MKVPLHCVEAAHCAEQVVRQHEIRSLPVDPFAIAAKNEIIVQAKPSSLPGVSGFLMKSGDTFGIMHASHIKNEGFVRFTVAHELGHYFLPGHPESLFPSGNGIHQSRSGFICHDQTEEEADHFAATLLMPPPLFSEAMEEAGHGFPAIASLASQCKTSLTATAIRFANHSPDPVAVIVSKGTKVEYCFLSDVLRDLRGVTWLRKGSLLPQHSETYAFNSNSENATIAATAEGWTSLDLWLDGAPAIEMKEDVVGLGSYDRTLTVLFTDEPMNDSDDDEED